MEDIDLLFCDMEDEQWVKLLPEARHKRYGGFYGFPANLYRYVGDNDTLLDNKLRDALVDSRQWLSSRTGNGARKWCQGQFAWARSRANRTGTRNGFISPTTDNKKGPISGAFQVPS